MRTDVITIRPSLPWQEAAALLYERHWSSAPVVDDNGRVIGILSEKDLFRGLFPSFREWVATPELYVDFSEMEAHATDAVEKTVADVMSTKVVLAESMTPILKVGAQMVASGIHHVPVVDDGRLVGMVGRGDIYRAILQEYFGMAKV